MNNYVTNIEEGFSSNVKKSEKGWRYGSEEIIYTERFITGRLLSASFQDNGMPLIGFCEEKQLYEARCLDKPSFDLVIDGESMYFGWEFDSFDEGIHENGNAWGCLTLRHITRPVCLKITTQCCGYGFFKRKLAIRNTSEDTVLGLTSVVPLSGRLWNLHDNLRDNLRDNTVMPYSIGHFKDFYWGGEGNFDWQDIPANNTEISYSSLNGRSGHSSPFFILRNNVYGGYFTCQLGWSGNWKTSVSTRFSNSSYSNEADLWLHFDVMPLSPAPARLIKPGETVEIPEVHFGMCHADFDTAIQNMHAYLRESVLGNKHGGIQPLIYNTAGYNFEEGFTEEALKEEVDIAIEAGAEVFMMDAGWFNDKGTSWFDTTGDWEDGNRLPNGMYPVFDYARQKGLKCGLWAEIESAGKNSRVATEHPDWLISRYGKSVERILDLAKPEVKGYIEEKLVHLIQRYKLDMFRIDYNHFPEEHREGGFNFISGRFENNLWRHVEAIYEIMDNISKRFPDLMLENNSSGGGRTDLGMVSRFDTTWISDYMRMPRTVRILNGMSMALPPEYLNRSFGVCMRSAERGNAETQMHAAILGHPAMLGLKPSMKDSNPAFMRLVKKYVSIYKEFIRTFHRNAKVYHHTPVIPGADGTGWCALEYVSQNRRKAVAGVFKLINAEGLSYLLKFRGLDGNLNYKISIEPDGIETAVRGYELMQQGVELRMDSALTSKLILLEAQ